MSASTAKKVTEFPIAPPPQEAKYEARASTSEVLQGLINQLNDKAGETGWRFALMQGHGKVDEDGITRMKAAGYESVTKAELTGLAEYIGQPIPLQSNEVLMRKSYGQFVADKARAQSDRDARNAKKGTTKLETGDGIEGEATATSTVVRVQSPVT